MISPDAAEIRRLERKIAEIEVERDTYQKRVDLLQNDLLESESRFAHLYQASVEGIVVYELQQIVLVNEALCNLFGYTREELHDLSIRELFSPAYQEDVVDKFLMQEFTDFECGCQRKDGSLFPAQITFRIIPHNGEDATVVVFRDMTESKLAEQELHQSEQLYRKLFEESRDAIYISGVRGELMEVNEATLDLFGYLKEEVKGMNALRLYAHIEDRQKFSAEMQKSGSVSNYEVKLVRKDGTLMDCLLSSTTRRNANLEIIGYQGIIRDITERNRTQELVKAKELAERSASMKEKFLANMSHEIRTPMNAVMGLTNLLSESDLKPDQHNYLNLIKRASEHLLVLINDILDFSKIEAGRLKFENIEFRLSEILNNIQQTFKFKAEEKKLDLFVTTENNLPNILVGDPTRLTQILLNLVSNALKFTEEGSITIDVKLFSEDQEKAFIVFSVTDTGIGIPKVKLGDIFDSFSQVSRDTTRKFGGTGLGLSITKKLVEMQGGTISVTSEPNQGSSFIFGIKFKKGEGRSLQFEPKLAEMKPLGPLRILIVEDNELNQVVARDTLRKWGSELSIDIAENGKKAIDILAKKTYDLVLMDVQMPEMNGYDATRYIRKVLKLTELPILAMTAFATTGEAEKTIMAGMNAYISKPFNPQKFYQKIVSLTKDNSRIENGQALNIKVSEPSPDSNLEKPSSSISTISNKEEKKINLPTKPKATDTITDFTFLDEATAGDLELKKSMLEIMIRETPDEVETMISMCSEKNWERLGAAAHKFKSATTYMGLQELKEVVKNIQVFAQKEIHLDELPTMVGQVKRTSAIACQEMKDEMERISN